MYKFFISFTGMHVIIQIQLARLDKRISKLYNVTMSYSLVLDNKTKPRLLDSYRSVI